MGRALVALLLGMGLAFLFPSRSVQAAAGDQTVFEAYAYRHVLESGDLLVVVRYELPVADWRTSTYVSDTTCADAEDFEDPCYTSLLEGAALQTLYDGPRATSTLRGIRQLPRIGDGLAALYFEAGHALTFGSSTYEVCTEGSATLFTPVPSSCLTILWRSTSTRDATQTQIEADLPQLMLNLEQAANQRRNRFVALDVITEDGMVFPREAFAAFMVVAPNAFFVGLDSPTLSFTPTPATQLSSALQTAAEASSAYTAVQQVAAEYGGVSIRTFGILALGVIGLLLVFVIGMMTSLAVGALAGALVLGFGVMMFFVPIQLIWVIGAIMLVLAAMFFYRRLPT